MSEVLRELVVALSLDSDNFSRNLRTINQQIKEAESTFRLAGAGVTGFEKSLQGTEAKLTLLSSKQKEQTRAVDQYSRALIQANQKLTDSHTRQVKMQSALVDAKAEYERLKQAVSSAANQYHQYKSSLGESDSATIAAKANLESFKEECAAARDRVKLLEGQIKSNSKTLQNNADAVSKAQTNLNLAKADLASTEAELKRLTHELYRQQSAWTKAGDSMAAFAKKTENVSKALVKAGRGYSRAITTPIVALGTAAIKSSIDYEYSFANVRKTVEATEEEYGILSDSIKKMSTQVASSGSDIAEVVAVAGQMGISNEHLITFARTMIDLGNSTDIVASEAALTMAKFANISGMNQSEFQNLGSALVDLGNNYAATESQILEMSMRLAGAGHQVGLSESQILGFATALSAVGLEAQMGGSAFSKALVKMEVASAVGGDALKDFAKVSGMTAQQFKALWDSNPAEAFQAFIGGLSKMDEEGISAIATLQDIGISEIRLRDTLLRATNATDLFARTQKTANDAWKQNTALTTEANKRYSTTKSRLMNLKNTAVLFAQKVGDDLNPALQGIIDRAHDLLNAFLGMDEGQRMAIIKFAGFAAAIGPAMLILGKTVGAVGKLSAGFGKFSIGLGKFSANVKTAGGGLGGFIKTIGSSKLAVAALAAAVIYGAVKLVDYATGAKKAREALQGMNQTASDWKNTAADTFYGKGGLSTFGMSESDFARDQKLAGEWLNGLLEIWSDGKRKNNATIKEWTDSFEQMTSVTREKLLEMQTDAKQAGYISVSDQLEQDIQLLGSMDKEIARLLKRRQSGKFTQKEQLRLQELIDTREAIEIKYKLSAADVDGFDTIREKLNAQIARAQAMGKPDIDVANYESAVVASAEGMASINAQLDAQYDKEYQLIQLMQNGAEKEQAIQALNQRYFENRRLAALEYASLLSDLVMPVWDQKDIQETDKGIDALYAKLREYNLAASRGDQMGMANALEDMNKLTAGLDEGKVAEYLGLLTQIQSLLDSGMSEAEVSALFPDIDVSTQLDQVAALTQFVSDHKTALSGLSSIFTDALPEEVLKIATDLDMTGAQARWTEFASNPGAITTQAVIDGYTQSETAMMIQPKLTAFIEKYTEVPEGASTASLSPDGLVAYVSHYAQSVMGVDVSGLSPQNITAMVSAYQELASGADVSTLAPGEITAYISSYLQKEGVDMSGITLDSLTAFVLAYEEATGGAAITALNPSGVAAMVTNYLEAEGIDISQLSSPQIEAVVNAYAEATGVDKTQLKAEVIAQITAYQDQEGVVKPSYIQSQIAVVGYDLAAYNAFVAANPVSLKGVVRLSEIYENPQDVTNDTNAKFWENGKEIPVNLVPANKIDASTLIAYDTDGTLHVLITPKISGTKEAVEQAAAGVNNPKVAVRFGWQNSASYVNAEDSIFGYLATSTMQDVKRLTTFINNYSKNKNSFLGAIDIFGSLKRGVQDDLKTYLSGDSLTGLQTYVSELVAAIKAGEGISEEDMTNLQAILEFVSALELAGVGENVVAGISAAMAQAGWETDAETTAGNLENALNAALGIQSPSTRMMPLGEYVAAGLGEGLAGFDLTSAVQSLATSLEQAVNAFFGFDLMAPYGVLVGQGLAMGFANTDLSSAVLRLVSRLRNTLTSYLSLSAFRPIGYQAMLGLQFGVQSGQAGVVNAMRAAARAAVNAAKSELKIQSPSQVFRDEVGRMSMRGWGQGLMLESKSQARTITNAARYLTEAAKESAVAYNTQDNRRTYHQSSSVNLTGNSFYVRDDKDIRALAIEIAALTRRQHQGRGQR